MEFRAHHLLHSNNARGSVLGFPRMMLQFRSAPTFAAASSSSLLLSLDSDLGSRFGVVVPAKKHFSVRSPEPHFPSQYSYKSVQVSRLRRRVVFPAAGAAEIKETEAEEEKGENSSGRRRRGSAFRCLSQISTSYNEIVILEAPETSSSQYAGSRVLLLDNSADNCMVDSLYQHDVEEHYQAAAYQEVCRSETTKHEDQTLGPGLVVRDEFASLPAVVPEGPVALLGLGGGTAARLLLELWPSLRVEGYEIDEILVEQARLHLGLSDLEIPTSEGGCLAVHVGDAFSPAAAVDGGFAGIIVDLFSEGGVVEELQKAQTWLNLQKKLMPGGRVMVNCGGICVEKGDPKTNLDDGTWTWEDGGATKDATLLAMVAAFEGQLNWKKMDSEADNCLALSGPLPNLEAWGAAMPERLKEGVTTWRSYT